jgi:hypothetical protein
LEPTDDQAAATRKALTVLRAWDGGAVDNLPVALHEAGLIVDEDGGPDDLLAGLITVAGFLLVNLEQRGQPPSATLQLVEAFARSQDQGGA